MESKIGIFMCINFVTKNKQTNNVSFTSIKITEEEKSIV